MSDAGDRINRHATSETSLREDVAVETHAAVSQKAYHARLFRLNRCRLAAVSVPYSLTRELLGYDANAAALSRSQGQRAKEP